MKFSTIFKFNYRTNQPNNLFKGSLGVLSFILAVTIFGMPAYADTLEYIPITLSENPVFCVFEPDMMFRTEILWQTIIAIDAWESAIYNHTDNVGNWNMPIKIITDNNSNTQDCTISINYFHQSKNNLELGGEIIYGFEDNTNDISIYVPQNTSREETLNFIDNVLRHEIGHSLGLGHYLRHDYFNNEDPKVVVDLSVLRFDIMEPVILNSDKPYVISQFDTSALLEKYGTDGFGGDSFKVSQNYFIDNILEF